MQGIQKLADKLENAQHRLKMVREKGNKIASRGMKAVAVVGGGAAAGALNGYMGKNGQPAKLGSTNVDLDMAIGLAATMAGIAEVGGSSSDTLTDFGAGMLAVAVARHTSNMVDDYAKK